jgi:hypothetical protein
LDASKTWGEVIPGRQQTDPGAKSPGRSAGGLIQLFFAVAFLLVDLLAVDLAGDFAVLLLVDAFFAAAFEALALAGALAAAFLPVDFAAVFEAVDFLDAALAADFAGDLLAEALVALDFAGALVADDFFVGATVAFFPALEVVFLVPRVAPPRPRS